MKQRGKRKTLTGVVVSDKMDKTVVVRVERTIKHPLYKKYIRRHKKFYAHDPKNEAKVGDVVKIVETRPLSKLKRWRIVEILQRGGMSLKDKAVEEVPEEVWKEVEEVTEEEDGAKGVENGATVEKEVQE